MLQQILSIRRTIFHLAYNADQFWMQTMNTEVNGCTFTCLNNLVFKLLLNLGNNLLYAGGVYTSVSNKLMQSKTANLTTNRIKSRYYDSLGCIINNNLNTCGSFKSTDVTSFTSDDTTLNLVVINMEHADRVSMAVSVATRWIV